MYNKKIESYRFEHTVPANILQNGVYYNFYFRTYDINDNESPISNVIPFKCYSTPTIDITNIPDDGIITSSNFTLDIRYNQDQGELIDFGKVLLYDQLGNKIFESKNIYNTNIPPINFQYTLSGLNDNTTYYVSMKINTVNRTTIESQKYLFTTRYFTPSLSTLLELTNNCEEGYVQIKNNFYIVDSESNPPSIGSNPKYLHDGKLWLTEDGTYIKWLQGFNIENDFTERLFVENPKLGKICILGSGNNRIELSFVEDYPYGESIKKKQLEVKCYTNSVIPYVIYSNFINNLSKVFIWVRRINNLFEARLEVLP